jgi:hypothetical protein
LLSSGTPVKPQSWNRYLYTKNNPLRAVDPTGLYDWGASLGGDKDDKDVSVDIRKKRNTIRLSISRAEANLEKIKAKYGDKSTKYTNAKNALDAWGTPGDKNGVTVGVVADTEQDFDGRTSGNTKSITVNFKESWFTDKDLGDPVNNGLTEWTAAISSSKLDSASSIISHEGTHILQLRQGLDPGDWNGEYNAIYNDTLFSEVQFNNSSSWFDVKATKSNPSGKIVFWNSAWKGVDLVETNRNQAIRQYLSLPKKDGGYGLPEPQQ